MLGLSDSGWRIALLARARSWSRLGAGVLAFVSACATTPRRSRADDGSPDPARSDLASQLSDTIARSEDRFGCFDASILRANYRGPYPSAPSIRICEGRRALRIKRPSDETPVRIPVLDSCGDPVPGPPKIFDVQVEANDVMAMYGMHCAARISLQTLAIGCACD
jgi:hypothetical protein